MAEIINAEGLSFCYEGSEQVVDALKSIDLKIFEGEYVALIGANGSGKSTLLKHFNALLTPTRGNVRVGGFYTSDPTAIYTIRQICGMVFQNPDNQIVATTVDEDVAFGPENLCLPAAEIRERVLEAMKIAGITSLASKAPHLLSGGEKQLVAVAGVLAMNPRCLLFDEVTSYLDPLGKKKVLDLMESLNREKKITVIHVTHSMEEAAMAHRVLIMNKGEIVADGLPGDILSDVELLTDKGLEPVAAVMLAKKLSLYGYKGLSSGITGWKELIEVLCS